MYYVLQRGTKKKKKNFRRRRVYYYYYTKLLQLSRKINMMSTHTHTPSFL